MRQVQLQVQVQKQCSQTSNDVDSSQTIQSTHQLPVGFFTLHPTFLLQRLQQFLHCHCAGTGYKQIIVDEMNQNTSSPKKTDQLHLKSFSKNLFWKGRNSPLTACGWQQAWRRRRRGYNMVVTVRRSKLPSFSDQSEIFLSLTRASWEQTSCWRW